ncbi:hypothetical protein [Pseudodesulfovibrio pelocollis]|uniref:hypothetical protein n=1 Tax=Pseudodesulfovibrio pelocollis TaxID=3051432 RepID=UPI00255B3E67|nr:hypothetical protein [Pseudodesulfovibrio sp. SB368]
MEIYLDQEILDICAEASTAYSAEGRVRQVITNADIDLFEAKKVEVNLLESGQYAGGNLSWVTKLRVVAKRTLGCIHVFLEDVNQGSVHVDNRFETDESDFGEAA